MQGGVALIRTIAHLAEIAWKEISCIKGRYLQTTPIMLQIILGLPTIRSRTGYIYIIIRLGTGAKIFLRSYQSMSGN